MRRAVLAIALGGLLAGGCGRQQDATGPEQLDPEGYGSLPGLKAVPDKKLRDELARITEEGGTPELIGKAEIPAEDNVAAGLAELFPQRQINSILARSEKIFPPREFEFDPIRLQRAINFRKKYDAERLRAREALGRPECDFGIRFMAGLAAELKFIDVVRICARLEAFRAAESLAGDDPSVGHKNAPPNGLDEAIEALGMMLRLASRLGTEKHSIARLEAAFLRTEAFGVLQAVVLDDRITRERLQRLGKMVQQQLAAWPDDADAWIGDRALGLHAYEMVRAGNLRDMLSDEEIAQYEQEDVLKELLTAASRGVNHDELYYLETMRKIIDSCSQPYHVRLGVFDSVADDLREKRSSPEFPIVAVWVLALPDIRKGHAIQAQDRANWEAWALALALATGGQPPAYRINPLTGKEYVQNKYEKTITVTNFGSGKDGDNPAIIVPNLAREN